MKTHMRAVALWLASIAAAHRLTTAGARAESLDGYWMDSHGEVILAVRPMRQGRVAARVAWLKKPRGPDRGPLRDFRNSDPKLQNRFVCGLVVVTGFKKQPDGTWADGNVYVPDHGMSFRGYAEVLDRNKVKVTGYMLMPIFGSSEVWTRMHAQAAVMRGAGEDDRRQQVVRGHVGLAAGAAAGRRALRLPAQEPRTMSISVALTRRCSRLSSRAGAADRRRGANDPQGEGPRAHRSGCSAFSV